MCPWLQTAPKQANSRTQTKQQCRLFPPFDSNPSRHTHTHTHTHTRARAHTLTALADVEGNFLLVLAYQYTTITSVQLLDCFTIPEEW
mmetsp:Transcript_15455/g.24713  ORF Transcript_15455/g.24713 Transcript_15455/m.24713 type:complete len:88 (+) Transcript_15455:133-396(+)